MREEVMLHFLGLLLLKNRRTLPILLDGLRVGGGGGVELCEQSQITFLSELLVFLFFSRLLISSWVMGISYTSFTSSTGGKLPKRFGSSNVLCLFSTLDGGVERRGG
jgi:hypothetical protein